MLNMDLSGAWTVAQAGKPTRYAAQVPGCVHTDLHRAGVIDDPMAGCDDSQLAWIGETAWTYRREVEVDASVLEHDRVVLEADGLDTLATVVLNGEELGRTDNMFRTWSWDVKPLLKRGVNRLEVRFEPVPEYVQRQQAAGRSKADAFKRSLVYDRPWTRKMQCNFGWDWGPRLLTCGIWRPMRLVAFSGARLGDVHIRQRHGRKRVTLDVAVSAEKAAARLPKLDALVRVALEGQVVAEKTVTLERGQGEVSLTIDDAKLWWPRGLGEQPLYGVQVQLQHGGQTVDETTCRIGLRRIEVQRKADRWGESFGFAVNGRPFFVRGANWIPAHVFPNEVAPADYERLLGDAADVNMNMLRVWGGGIYEFDTFYDICDRLGILVWQDFMFACARYPAFDRDWMRTVQAEAEDQVRRLRHHACLALWCGNNECENERVVGKKWERKITRWSGVSMAWSDYLKLFDGVLGDVAQELGADTPYWPASPHTPTKALDKRAHSGSPDCGDAHVWGVWFDNRTIEEQCTSGHRFVSETGFQALPHPRTLTECVPTDEMNLGSPTLELRQRCQAGNTTLVEKMSLYLRQAYDFRSVTYASQIMQSLVLETTIEHWRRSMQRTRGVIYWQLNDCWPGVTWASIDFAGRWKALHYRARHFYAPVMVSATIDEQTQDVEIVGCNDTAGPANATLQWTLMSLEGRRLDRGSRRCSLLPDRATSIATLPWGKHVAKHGAGELLGEVSLVVDRKVVSRHLVRWVRPKALNLQEPELDVTVKQRGPRRFEVTLKAKRPALWVWLDVDGVDAHYSDNFVHVLPGAAQRVRIETPRDLSLQRFEKQLQVMTLRDSYLPATVTSRR